MTVKGGPKIETDGLVFHLDAAARNKSYPIDGLDVEYLMVAGGGGSARIRSGGGGAGGLLHGYTTLTTSVGTYPIVVGGGGTHNASSNYGTGSNGSNTTFNDLEAIGGGAGSYYTAWATSGGSGGGNSHYCCGIPIATGVAGQGHDGGLGRWWGQSSAGGGGAGEAGYIAGNVGEKAGKGGDGLPFSIEGHTKYYAGGGAGGTHRYNDASTWSLDNVGGLGGGGDSSQPSPDPNSGGGSGGSTYWSNSSGSGSSGIVVIRYKGSRKATGGDSIYYDKGYTIHVFTSSGNFVVGDRVGGTSRNKVVGELINMDNTNYKTGNRGYWNLATDEYIDCSSHIDDLIFSSPATISTWLMPLHDKNAGSTFFFIGNDTTAVSNGTGAYGFLIRYGSTTGALTGETFVVYRYDGGNAGNQLTLYGISDGYEYQNQWVNATVVVESNTWKLYVNGILQTLTRGTFWTGAQFKYGESMSPKNRALIGTSGANVRLADVKVYNTALTQQQILDNYNATKGRFGL